MAITVTSEQAIGMAPDPESVKAARSLAAPRTWSALGCDGRAIWGACQGSGKDPYRTQVDWQGPAFKCSCPSRKFPCKHGLALLLLLADQPALFTAPPPAWVTEWLATRDEKAETKAKEEAAPAKPPDPEAAAKRAGQRAARVAQGLGDLSLWMQDLVSHGLASLPGKPFSFWEQQAARLVDAQAPGAARLVRELGAAAMAGEGWQHRVVDGLARLHLLMQAYARIDALPASTQEDVRALVGFTVAQEAVLAGEAVRGAWLVAGQAVEQEERLRVQRTWLLDANSRRAALVLEFAAGPGAGFKTALPPGAVVDAELCYYPGASPLRALVKQVHEVKAKSPGGLVQAGPLAEAFAGFRERLAANPWTQDQPAALAGVTPVRVNARWFLRDAAGDAVPLRAGENVNLVLAALSAGGAFDLFGVWDGYTLEPWAVWCEGGRMVTPRRATPEAA
ncbi:MAG: SWIM zinc finger family protein [Bryobacterales bacterium]|nr:SWIM zinc finger family protein [Bryobacterales bacterium]